MSAAKLSEDNVKIDGLSNEFRYLLMQRLDRFATLNGWKAKKIKFMSDHEEQTFSFSMGIDPETSVELRTTCVGDMDIAVDLIEKLGWNFVISKTVNENRDGSPDSLCYTFSDVVSPSVFPNTNTHEGAFDNNHTLSLKQGAR